MLIKEEFLQFIPLDDLSAESIVNHIINCVARLELDINNCVGRTMTARPPCQAMSQGFRHGFEKRRLQQTTYTVLAIV